MRLREQLNNILTKHTGQSLKRVERDTDRDLFFTSKQAQEYGIIDEVIANRPGKAGGDPKPPEHSKRTEHSKPTEHPKPAP